MTADLTSGTETLYRVWLGGKLVCSTSSGSLAMWALTEAKRWAARAFPANDTDPTPPPAAPCLQRSAA